MIAAFEVGKTYSTRSMCDYDTIYKWKVEARTPHFLTISGSNIRGTKKVGVRVYAGAERTSPLGSYSMCPVINAKDTA